MMRYGGSSVISTGRSYHREQATLRPDAADAPPLLFRAAGSYILRFGNAGRAHPDRRVEEVLSRHTGPARDRPRSGSEPAHRPDRAVGMREVDAAPLPQR